MRSEPSSASRVPQVLAFLVVAFALLLRVHALTMVYGNIGTPRLVSAVQDFSRDTVGRWVPKRVSWQAAPLYPHKDGPPTHYFSDPYTYLQFGRAMRSFYAAHYREPMVPFSAKVSLALLHDQDVAVSFASVFFSVLAVATIYLVGSLAFSPPVGLIAAAAFAVEYDAVTESITGGRDSAFTFAVVFATYCAIRYVRRPSLASVMLLGASAGFACLVRLTSISFVVPLLLYALVKTPGSWKARGRRFGTMVIVLLVLVGPYMYNCWRQFGDPFYAINWHTETTLPLDESETGTQPSAMTYARTRFASRPFQLLDTVAEGVTRYPFLNKWNGFDRWISGLGAVMSSTALIGLVWLAGSANGRVILGVLLASMLPYAFTWKIANDWRFTEHAYPFYLLGAGALVVQVVRWLLPSTWKTIRERTAAEWRTIATFWTAAAAALAFGFWIVARLIPALTVREAIAAQDDGMMQAGDRDGVFFSSGWSAARPIGTIVMRVSNGRRSTVSLPLPASQDYTAIVRVNPFPEPNGSPAAAPVPLLHVAINGQPLGDLPVQWTPGRVGSYNVHLSHSLVRKGSNALTFTPEPIGGRAPQFSVWYVRVHTADDAASWRQAIEPTPQPHIGYLDTASCATLEGWVMDLSRKNDPADVDVFDGEVKLLTATAAEFRPDLLKAGLGNGRHSYRIPVPPTLRDGGTHVVSVRVAGTRQHLTGSPVKLTCKTPAP